MEFLIISFCSFMLFIFISALFWVGYQFGVMHEESRSSRDLGKKYD